MRLVCPNCGSQYEVDGSLFPEEGREVQCSSCEETWIQYPKTAEAPLRLDEAAAPKKAPDAPAAAPAAPADGASLPSNQLSEDERAALKAAVEEEISIRNAAAERDPMPAPEAEKELDEDEILSALRKQIELEGGDFEPGDGEVKSQRRNLKAAAEAVGISVAAETAKAEEDKRKKAEAERREKEADSRPKRRDPSSQKLAAALEEYEADQRGHRRTGRMGFAAAIVICLVGLGVYMTRDAITDAYPPAGPWLDRYAALVDDGRARVETLYAEYSPVVASTISGFTAGEDAATAAE